MGRITDRALAKAARSVGGSPYRLQVIGHQAWTAAAPAGVINRSPLTWPKAAPDAPVGIPPAGIPWRVRSRRTRTRAGNPRRGRLLIGAADGDGSTRQEHPEMPELDAARQGPLRARGRTRRKVPVEVAAAPAIMPGLHRDRALGKAFDQLESGSPIHREYIPISAPDSSSTYSSVYTPGICDRRPMSASMARLMESRSQTLAITLPSGRST